MLENKTIAVVVPCYNEETQISTVITTMPDFVDRIIIINDCSKDKTEQVVLDHIKNNSKSSITIKKPNTEIVKNKYNEAEIVLQEILKEQQKLFTPYKILNQSVENERIILINHIENAGVGGAIATGYNWCREYSIDCTAVMAGDGQMDPSELESICLPVVQSETDYVKGNRLIHKSAWYVIPRIRFIGNSILSMMTKISSGYWHISDTQTGYTAISLNALESIELHKIYKRYGMPNDMLVKLNMVYCSVKEVPIKPIYRVGEQSKMKIHKVIPTISWLLLKSFFKRLWGKYFFKDFHPIFLFYNFGFLLSFINIFFLLNIFNRIVIENGVVSLGTYMAFTILSIASFQSFMFAMWMDINENERLYK